MSDVEKHTDPVTAETVRLFADATHGAYSEVARAAAVTPEAVRLWAKGINRPPKKRWPAIEDYFDLPAGHLARKADEAPPVVVDRSDDQLTQLRLELVGIRQALDSLVGTVGTTQREVAGVKGEVKRLAQEFGNLLEDAVSLSRAVRESRPSAAVPAAADTRRRGKSPGRRAP